MKKCLSIFFGILLTGSFSLISSFGQSSVLTDTLYRPGMVVIAKLPDGRYFMIYEVVGIRNVPVYFRYSEDGLNWGDYKDLGTKITDTEGNFMSGTPYIVWTPLGGNNGTLIATAKSQVSLSISTGTLRR